MSLDVSEVDGWYCSQMALSPRPDLTPMRVVEVGRLIALEAADRSIAVGLTTAGDDVDSVRCRGCTSVVVILSR